MAETSPQHSASIEVEGLVREFRKGPRAVDGIDLAEEVVRRTVEELPERERDVIKLRFGLDGDREPLPLTQVGQRVGVSAETVREIEKRALAHLGLRRELDALRDAA